MSYECRKEYHCDTGARDVMSVYRSECEVGEYPTVSFVIESKLGDHVTKTSVILDHKDVRVLRDQLNELLGE